jgi:hypothetical protein
MPRVRLRSYTSSPPHASSTSAAGAFIHQCLCYQDWFLYVKPRSCSPCVQRINSEFGRKIVTLLSDPHFSSKRQRLHLHLFKSRTFSKWSVLYLCSLGHSEMFSVTFCFDVSSWRNILLFLYFTPIWRHQARRRPWQGGGKDERECEMPTRPASRELRSCHAQWCECSAARCRAS